MWNLANVNTLSRQHQHLEQYYKHKSLVKTIKNNKGTILIDDSEPCRPAFLQGEAKNRKKKMQRDMEIEVENRCLFMKMQEVTNKPGELNPILLKKQMYQKGSLNLDSRVQNMKTIINQNQFMENRLQNMKSIVDIKQKEKEYQINESYIKSISKHSRRIVNCFLDQEKKKKYASSTSLMNKQGRPLQHQSEANLNQKPDDNEDQDEQQEGEGFFITGQQQDEQINNKEKPDHDYDQEQEQDQEDQQQQL